MKNIIFYCFVFFLTAMVITSCSITVPNIMQEQQITCRINVVNTDGLYSQEEASNIVLEFMYEDLNIFDEVYNSPNVDADYELEVYIVDNFLFELGVFFTLKRVSDGAVVINHYAFSGSSFEDVITGRIGDRQDFVDQFESFLAENPQPVTLDQVQVAANNQNQGNSNVTQQVNTANTVNTVSSTGDIRLILPRNIYAIVIGVGNYMDSRDFPSLEYAADDAIAIRDMLKNPDVIGVPQGNITLLINEEATSRNIFLALENVKRIANEQNNLIFFYFSGHGAPITHGSGVIEDGAIVPYDAAIGSLERTAILISELTNEINNHPSSAIVMLDSCFSGPDSIMDPTVRGISVSPRHDLVQSSDADKVFITGSGDDQYSNEYPQGNHGLFTYFVLQGLGDRRAESDHDGYITMAELYNYLSANVTRISATLSGYQEPQITGNGLNLSINP